MFVRKLISKKGGQEYIYLKLVENHRVKGKIVQRTLVNFGNINFWSKNKVKELIIKLLSGFQPILQKLKIISIHHKIAILDSQRSHYCLRLSSLVRDTHVI